MPSLRGDVTASFAQEALTRQGALWVREATPSMLPLIRPGDELLLAPLGSRQIRVGALIAYRREAQLIIHRVLAVGGSGVLAKGDALASPDPLVPWDRVVARVVALRRANGRAVNLDAFPWPLLNRLLAGIASVASHLSREAPQPLTGRLGWKALRVPFYLARLLVA